MKNSKTAVFLAGAIAAGAALVAAQEPMPTPTANPMPRPTAAPAPTAARGTQPTPIGRYGGTQQKTPSAPDRQMTPVPTPGR